MYIDTHCHILWGVDDASKTLEESLNMLQIASADNIDIIVATSHVKYPLFPNTKEKLYTACDLLNEEIKKRNLNIRIVPGAENFVAHSTIHLLEENKFIPYNHGKYLLVEFAWSKNVYDHPTLYLKQIIDYGFIPVIAHPERYEIVHDDFSLLKKWRSMGCLMQVNRTSIFGLDKIQKANECAIKMLEEDLVDLIASDAHRSFAPRYPKLSDIYKYIEEHYGKVKANQYLIETPNKIIKGD